MDFFFFFSFCLFRGRLKECEEGDEDVCVCVSGNNLVCDGSFPEKKEISLLHSQIVRLILPPPKNLKK